MESGTGPTESFGDRSSTGELVIELLAAIPQWFLSLMPRSCHWPLSFLFGRGMDNARGVSVLIYSVLMFALGSFFCGIVMAGSLVVIVAWAHTWPKLVASLAEKGIIESDSGWLSLIPSSASSQMMYIMPLAYATGLLFKVPYDRFAKPFVTLRGVLWVRSVIARLTSLLMLLGLGMLPLATLLMFLPLVMPEEAILSDTMRPATSRLRRWARKLFAVVTGMSVLTALVVFGFTVVSALGLRSPIFGELARQIFGKGLTDRLPPAFVEGWPFMVLIIYATDFFLLFAIGKVPLSYNFRNLRVRWVTTLMTGVAFTVVVGLLIVMSSFVDSVRRLTASSGVPGNVFVLSEGSTDELFSNLGYGDVGKLELESALTDPQGRPLPGPLGVRSQAGREGAPPLRWVSKETYFVINQEIPKPSGQQARRFVQLRGIDSAEAASKVHDIALLKGEWFGTEGGKQLPDGTTAVPCVLGEGASTAFGEDYGRARLEIGDTFMLGNAKMVVVGIMKSAGKTFDSETWATNARVSKEFGKQSFTTVVIRVADENPETIQRSADTFAFHLTKNFTNPRVRAVSEVRYYEDLAKSNSQLMTMVVAIALIMAAGGIIGVMLVMFAAIAQRIKDIGVLRVLGYKRWQVLVSFMLESLAIAILGGLAAVVFIMILDAAATAIQGGLSITSNISSGQGGKTVVTNLVFSMDVYSAGLLFTVVMGRLGGLLPSVSAMRLGILESLR